MVHTADYFILNLNNYVIIPEWESQTIYVTNDQIHLI